MSNLHNIQFVSNQHNIGAQSHNSELQVPNLKMVVIKVIAKDINEASLYKLKLIENKRYRKIYEVIEDKKYKNILYIYMAPGETINDLLCAKIIKEDIPTGHARPINEDELTALLKKKECMCKIIYNKKVKDEIKNAKASGFFLEINISGISCKKWLITNNHVINLDFFQIIKINDGINQDSFQLNKDIIIEYNNEKKSIQIDNSRKIYTSQSLDYTCVEISDINYIKDFFHINPQALKNNINIFIGKDIFITQYPSGRKFSLSTGNILGISKNNYFVHTCSTMKGSSGSPIILRDDSSIIGLHHSSFSEMEEDGKKKNPLNLATPILFIIQNLIMKIKSDNHLFSNKNNGMNKFFPPILNNNNISYINNKNIFNNTNNINNNFIINNIHGNNYQQIQNHQQQTISHQQAQKTPMINQQVAMKNQMIQQKSKIQNEKIPSDFTNLQIMQQEVKSKPEINHSLSKYKETLIDIHLKPMTKEEILELYSYENALCKINIKQNKNARTGTGFFLEIDNDNIPFKKTLFTNNHILNDYSIKMNEEIVFEYCKEIRKIKITPNRKVFTNKELDYTCIEIFDRDEIRNFFRIDENVFNNKRFLRNKEIFILQYSLGRLSHGSGKILDIESHIIKHSASTEKGSSGSPLIKRYNNKLIFGIHFGARIDFNQKLYNLAIPFDVIIKDIKDRLFHRKLFVK